MMAFSGVRSSWLMVARKRVLAASACSAALRARSSACSWSLRSVTSRITATTSARASGDPACSSGRQRISTQMKSTAPIVLAANCLPPQTKLDAARLAAARGVRQRGEIGRTIGDMDAIEQAMAEQPRDRHAEHGFGRRRNELHRAVAADGARSRRSCCAPAGDSALPRRKAARRWCAPATPRRRQGPRHRASPKRRRTPSARRATPRSVSAAGKQPRMSERDQQRRRRTAPARRQSATTRREADSAASSGTTTSQIAAKDSMPPVVTATAMTRPASASDDSTCAPS